MMIFCARLCSSTGEATTQPIKVKVKSAMLENIILLRDCRMKKQEKLWKCYRICEKTGVV